MPGDKDHSYSIEYLKQVVEEDIPFLPKQISDTIKRAIETRLMRDPIGFGKPLQYSLKGHRRLRVGNYRVVYRIDSNNHLVTIVAIKHRKNIYENC
jgi:mRNA interferase RelE/StbE